MKRLIISLLTVIVASIALAADVNLPAIIPQPVKLERQEGAFVIGEDTRILTDAASQATGELLAKRLRQATGFKLDLATNSDGQPGKGNILVTTRDAKAALGSEGYELKADTGSVVIRASDQAGMLYGVQTLLQLLPPQVFATNVAKDVSWAIPGVNIEDQPRFGWRGLMLDVCRHFFTKEEVKRYLDIMALHKMNTFHWHLTDDQGWRIEIKKYPRLTEVGAWRSDIGFGLDPKRTTAYGKDGRYGGFYTQDDIREVVAYAAKLHITVVPEIEMPGHASAVLAAYPQFVCPNVKFTGMPNRSGVFHGIYCAGNDASYSFIEDVLTEVAALFPGKYIHIGGDECPKDNWKTCPKCQARIKENNLKNEHELQSYFIRRVEKIVSGLGKNLIGWSEIREGGLAESAALMDWIGGGAESAASGHDVVMSPTSRCYLDYFQTRDIANEPKGIGGYIPLEVVYTFEPVPANLAPKLHHRILGGQGNLWTEFIPNFQHLQYMAYPRACAIAEAVWSPKDARDYPGFLKRLAIHQQRLDQLGVTYYRPNRPETKMQIGVWKPAQIKTGPAPLEWDVTKNVIAAGKGRVSLDYTGGAHGIDIAWVALLEDGREVSRDAHAGFTGSNPRQPVYTLDVPAPKSGARYTIRAQVAGAGGTDSVGTVNWEFNPPK